MAGLAPVLGVDFKGDREHLRCEECDQLLDRRYERPMFFAGNGLVPSEIETTHDSINTFAPEPFTQGARLWRSPDGDNWTEEVGPNGTLAPPGLGVLENMGFRSLETYDGDLFIGTAQCPSCFFTTTGTQVWQRTAACND